MSDSDKLNRSTASLAGAKKLGPLQVDSQRKGLKKRWVILHTGTLYTFNNDNDEKAKEALTLTDYTEAVAGDNPNEFKLHRQEDKGKVVLFSAATPADRDAWVEAINHMKTDKYSYGRSARLELSCNLKIGEVKLKNDEAKDTFWLIYVDEELKARTSEILQTHNPIFNSEHEFDLDASVKKLTMQIKDAKKRTKNVIGQVIVPFSDFEDGKLHDKWYKLSPDDEGDASEDIGQVKLTIQTRTMFILQEKMYEPLFDLMLADDFALCKRLSAVSNKKEKVVADCLVKSFENLRSGVRFIKSMTTAEINETNDPNVIFRGNTVCTKSLDTYMRLTGMAYLHHVMKPIINQIMQNGKDKKKSCELDPTRIMEGDDAKKAKVAAKNLKNLISYVSSMFDAIRNSLSVCPASFRSIFDHIRKTINSRFPEHPVAQYTATSGFIFLRFFCPCLLAPKNFDLVTEEVPANVTRDLTVIAKTVQNMANLVIFGKKEPFMIPCNEYIEQTKDDMKKFLDELCTIPDQAIDELPNTKRAVINWSREMAHVFGHFSDSWDSLNQKFPGDPVLGKLEDVLKHLDNEISTKLGGFTDDSLGISSNSSNKRATLAPPTSRGTWHGENPPADSDSIPVSPSPTTTPFLPFNSTGPRPIPGASGSPFASHSLANSPGLKPPSQRHTLTVPPTLVPPAFKKSPLANKWAEQMTEVRAITGLDPTNPSAQIPPPFSSVASFPPPFVTPTGPSAASGAKSCPMCKKPLVDKEPSINAYGHKWHVGCFRCSDCRTPIRGPFISKGGAPKCNDCRPQVSCGKCKLDINGGCVVALGKGYHPECLKCHFCEKAFSANEAIYPHIDLTDPASQNAVCVNCRV